MPGNDTLRLYRVLGETTLEKCSRTGTTLFDSTVIIKRTTCFPSSGSLTSTNADSSLARTRALCWGSISLKVQTESPHMPQTTLLKNKLTLPSRVKQQSQPLSTNWFHPAAHIPLAPIVHLSARASREIQIRHFRPATERPLLRPIAAHAAAASPIEQETVQKPHLPRVENPSFATSVEAVFIPAWAIMNGASVSTLDSCAQLPPTSLMGNTSVHSAAMEITKPFSAVKLNNPITPLKAHSFQALLSCY